MDNRAIGVFDSGLGGLTVLKELKKQLPNEDYIYFGDTKRLPYGSKNKETIINHSKQIVDFLMEQDVKIIVIACNTITVNAMEYLQDKVDITFFGTASPGVRAALRKTKNKKISLLATEATVTSGVYEKKLKEIDKEVEVFSVPCPKFVPMIENNMEETEEMHRVVEETVSAYKDKGIDTAILGCTHYPYILDTLQKVCGDEVEFINPAVELTREIKEFLISNGMENLNRKVPTCIYYTSGNTDKFNKDGSRHMGKDRIEVLKKEFE